MSSNRSTLPPPSAFKNAVPQITQESIDALRSRYSGVFQASTQLANAVRSNPTTIESILQRNEEAKKREQAAFNQRIINKLEQAKQLGVSEAYNNTIASLVNFSNKLVEQFRQEEENRIINENQNAEIRNSTVRFVEVMMRDLARMRPTDNLVHNGPISVTLLSELLIENRQQILNAHNAGFYLSIALKRDRFFSVTPATINQIIERTLLLESHYEDVIISDDEFQPAYRVVQSTRIYSRREVNYFPYLIKDDCKQNIDPDLLQSFNKAQIYTESEFAARGEREHCLINAIRESCGITINLPEDYMIDGYVSVDKYSQIAIANNITIEYKYLDGKGILITKYRPNKKSKQYNSEHPVARVCSYDKHAMPYPDGLAKRNNFIRKVDELVKSNNVRKMNATELELIGNDMDVGLPPIPMSIVEGMNVREYQNSTINRVNKLQESINEGSEEIPDLIVYFDIETYKKVENLTISGKKVVRLVHKPFMVSYSIGNNIYTKIGDKCILEFLNAVRLAAFMWDKQRDPKTTSEREWCKKNGKIQYIPRANIIIYAHNAGFYDSTFIVEHLSYASPMGTLSNNKGYNGKFRGDTPIKIRDTMAFLTCKLADMPKLVQLQIKLEKEVLPYDLYDFHSVTLTTVPFDIAKRLVKPSDLDRFVEASKSYVIDGNFRHMDYCKFYCERDVQVLRDCFNKFSNQVSKGMGMYIHDFVTTPSLADGYLTKQGSYDNVNELGGDARAYCQAAVEGGRCNTAGQKKIDRVGNILDLDANSLYPCAMMLLKRVFGGIPTGKPEILTKDKLNVRYVLGEGRIRCCIVTAKINSITLKRAMSVLSCENVEGVSTFRNDRPVGSKIYINDVPEGGLVVRISSVKLMTLLLVHGCTGEHVEILDGLEWTNFNPRISDVIEYLYDMRLKEKAKGADSLEGIYKLIMNSGYGKNGQRPFRRQRNIQYYANPEHLNQILGRQGEKLMNFAMIGTNKVLTETHTTNICFNRCHVSAFILDASKLLMFRLYDAIERVGGEVYYTDTDSIHFDVKYLESLKRECGNDGQWGWINEMYGLPSEIEGIAPFQFKSDFKVSGKPDRGTTPYSVRFIGLGAKAYMHKIHYIENGEIKYDYTYKIKGIPTSAIDGYCSKHNLSVEGLFESMYEGTEIEFDMLANDRVSFEKDKRGNIYSLLDFKRKVKF